MKSWPVATARGCGRRRIGFSKFLGEGKRGNPGLGPPDYWPGAADRPSTTTTPPTGALLMDRIVPGTPLHVADLGEHEMDQLWSGFVRPWQHFPTDGMVPLSEFFAATPLADLRDELLASSPEPVFLHGDLHHENLLQGAGRTFWVIDPKGLVGDPCFEAAAWLRNPRTQSREPQGLGARLDRRLEFLSTACGWDRWRMQAWTLLTLDDPNDPPDPNTFWDDLLQLLRHRLNFA